MEHKGHGMPCPYDVLRRVLIRLMKDFIIKEDRLSEKERRNLSILDAIRRGKEISRAEISKLTDLNIVTVSNYINKYVKNKIVLETGLDISTGGRRPELLTLNRRYGYAIGIDLGAPQITADSYIIAVIMDLSGRILSKEKIKKENESFEQLIEKVMLVTERLINKSGIHLAEIKGIGVGIWGVMDRYRNMVRYPVEDGQIVNYAGLLSTLENKFNLPVSVEHDAALAAFGERWSGLGAVTHADNLIFVCSDSSCGFIVGGEVYYGSTKSAGELNLNPPIKGSGKPDNCWDGYDYGCCLRSRGVDLGISEKVKRRVAENEEDGAQILSAAGGKEENIDLEIIAAAAEDGVQVAKEELENAGKYLGVKIAFLINLFNPEVVIIGRGIEKAGSIFFQSVRKAIKEYGYEESVKIVKVLTASLGEDAVAAGAAALIVKNIFIGS